MTAVAPALADDLVAGLKRLRLAHFRAQAAEILQTATTQRWPPEQLLRTLLTAELAGRNAANQAARLRGATFPGEKRFEDSKWGPHRCPRPRWTTSPRWSGCGRARTCA